jgi:hypothetical protein
MSKLRLGDKFMFTPGGAVVYDEFHPGAPVDEEVWRAGYVMGNILHFFPVQTTVHHDSKEVGELRWIIIGHETDEISVIRVDSE